MDFGRYHISRQFFLVLLLIAVVAVAGWWYLLRDSGPSTPVVSDIVTPPSTSEQESTHFVHGLLVLARCDAKGKCSREPMSQPARLTFTPIGKPAELRRSLARQGEYTVLLPPGKYRVEARWSGGKDVRQLVVPEAGEPRPLVLRQG